MNDIIQQGDQYWLSVKVETGEGTDITAITPDNCDDMKIKLGDVTKQYSKGELEFDDETQSWLFLLTQEMTLDAPSARRKIQVQYKNGGDIIGSEPEDITVNFSIITEEW